MGYVDYLLLALALFFHALYALGYTRHFDPHQTHRKLMESESNLPRHDPTRLNPVHGPTRPKSNSVLYCTGVSAGDACRRSIDKWTQVSVSSLLFVGYTFIVYLNVVTVNVVMFAVLHLHYPVAVFSTFFCRTFYLFLLQYAVQRKYMHCDQTAVNCYFCQDSIIK